MPTGIGGAAALTEICEVAEFWRKCSRPSAPAAMTMTEAQMVKFTSQGVAALLAVGGELDASVHTGRDNAARADRGHWRGERRIH